MNGIKQEMSIKSESEVGTPRYMSDSDGFEDTGELNLPLRNPDIWLTRIPVWLWHAIMNTDYGMDEEIEIGKVAYHTDPTGHVAQDKPMRIFFSDKLKLDKDPEDKRANDRQNDSKLPPVPKAFELTTHHSPVNTYVFTEKDMPGYKPQPFGGYGRNRMDQVAHGLQDSKSKVQKRGRWRKAIPKHTTLVGAATRDYIAKPLETVEYKDWQSVRTLKTFEGNKKTNIIDNPYSQRNEKLTQDAFSGFVRPNQAPKRQENKAARIPKNELIDMLHGCFDQYAYWPMKELKRTTRQPEAYLKETLQEIADLVKTGTFASCWRRNPEFNCQALAQVQDKPPSEGKDEDTVM